MLNHRNKTKYRSKRYYYNSLRKRMRSLKSKNKTKRINKKIHKNIHKLKYKGGNDTGNDSGSMIGNGSTSRHTKSNSMREQIKRFKLLNCAPKSGAGKIDSKNYTCYSSSSLAYLKNYWNKRHPDALITTNNPKEIWKQLKSHMSNVCDRESCWLKQNFIKDNLNRDLLHSTFAPKSPSTWKINKNQWLTSLDIDKVMKQYEDVYKCFEFIGPSPIDFDSHQKYNECVWEELCKFDLTHYINKGKTKIGIIFNTY